MRLFRIFWIGLLFPLAAFAQILTWAPVYLTEEDSVVIYYDASQGNQGLKGFSGDVYAHTGVITTASATPKDWKHVVTKWGENTPETKLERISPDLYKFVISPDIRQFYGISAGETVLELAFVFRSANTFLQGKSETGGDIFLPLRTGLRIQQPAADLLFADPGDVINVLAVSTAETEQLQLFINNVPTYGVANDTLEYVYTVNTQGQIRFRIDALIDGVVTAADSFTVVVTPEIEVAPRPVGMDDGINYIDEQTVVLSQYAPGKAFVYVIGDFNDWQPHPDYLMKLTPDRQTWWLEINDLIPGQEYAFQYLFDGELRIADPYADKVLDPWNDKHITENTYPDLMPYPVTKTNGIVSVLQTDQVPYEWGSLDFERPEKSKLIIYELLIRDFIAEHSYAAVIDSLDYLQRLGVNAIELMPINEFDGNLSWGYNPAFYFAPDKYYGHKNELKRFVDACHSRGIAVILDMVLNHSTAQSPLARMYWNKTKNQPAANNPWYNENPAPGQYDWGFEDFNHESYRTKGFVDRVNQYWLSEYNIDGYRFDFTKGFTNVPGSGDAYDGGRVKILKRMADEIWAEDSTAYVILEHWGSNAEEEELADYGMMLWGNLNSAYNEATMGYNVGSKSDFSRASYQTRGWENPYLVSYMESHDEERLMYKNLTYGNSAGEYNIKDATTALNRIKLASVFFFTIPGPKMIWQFGELGYDVNIDYNGRVGEKPIRWGYYQEPERVKLFKTMQSLIQLKRTYPVFETTDFQTQFSGSTKRLNLSHESMDVTIIGNFDVQNAPCFPNFQQTGRWYDYFSGDSIEVSDENAEITLPPGDFHIYTTQKLPTPEPGFATGITSSETQLPVEFRLEQNFPNPFNPATTIEYSLASQGPVRLIIYNSRGQRLHTLVNSIQTAGRHEVHWSGTTANGSPAAAGIYWYQLEFNGRKQIRKMVYIK